MKTPFSLCASICSLALFALGMIGQTEFARGADAEHDPGIALAGVHGGLVVQIGADDTEMPIALAATGRYVINVLDSDTARVARARERFREAECYGLVTAEPMKSEARLPYSENLVNLVVIREPNVGFADIFRVLVPDGVVLVRDRRPVTKQQLLAAGFVGISETRVPVAAGGRLSDRSGNPALLARKPWPTQMDQWSHSRHEADGNAVSSDTMVGPPERVRWVAAATREVEGMVSAGGRNFYGGILARDSFNGLRLWHQDVSTAQRSAGAFSLAPLPVNQARPVAAREHLYAILGEKLVALDAATGNVAIEFAGITRPKQIAYRAGVLVAADDNFVRAFSAENGRELWNLLAGGVDNLVMNDEIVCFTQGRVKRGEKSEALAVELKTGKIKWRTGDYEWLSSVTRTVLHDDHLAFEVSTLNDHDLGNAIHIVSATSGTLLWEKPYAPGMNHKRQARAMFLDSGLWILHGGKTNTVDKEKMGRLPVQVSALNPATGETLVTHEAGLAHCFPPIATPNYLFAGVLDMTDLSSGNMVVNPITKAHCSLENGWVPANGLIYTTPKHCTCWPMLRGYVGLAARGSESSPANLPVERIDFAIERGPGKAEASNAKLLESDWPLYRNDRWRSGSTASPGPKSLGLLWSANVARKIDLAAFGNAPLGPILHDWRENPFVKGPVSAPTIANGIVYVTRPNAHEVVAIDANTGDVRWRFTADGRVDTPPAIHRGLCLFGSQAGSVYALSANSGEMVWRLQAAPTNERIVAYGQVESPWPVSGAVLIIDDVAYFAAGRQPLADGGILIFAIDPMTGNRHWVHRLDTIPQKGFYENSGLEFDPIDIMHQEGDRIAMSRWLFSRDGKSMEVDKWDAFALLNMGNGSAYVPRGSWTYGPRQQHRFPGEPSRRALCVSRDRTVFGVLDGTTEIFRRDFDLENGEEFTRKWMTGWEAGRIAREGGSPFRSYHLAEKARWKSDAFTPSEEKAKPRPRGAQLYNDIYAMALSGDGRLFAVHKDGRLKCFSAEDGRVLSETRVSPPAWDGLAIANGRLFLATQSGGVVCLGGE